MRGAAVASCEFMRGSAVAVANSFGDECIRSRRWNLSPIGDVMLITAVADFLAAVAVTATLW